MNSAVQRAQLARDVVQTMGPKWVAQRARYEVKRRSGYLKRRLPARKWDELPLSGALRDAELGDPAAYLNYRRSAAPRFFFDVSERPNAAGLFAGWDRETGGPLPAANDLARGTFRYFHHAPADLGMPPDWHRNPFTGERVPGDRHWTEIGDFGHGDIKVIWEPSRFGFAFDLVRAYWRDGDNRHAELFWMLLESWRAANPPNLGPNWKCGQETSLRVMAWCFALYGLLDAPATAPDRVAMIGQMIAFSGQRIEATLDYALSQRNNHGVSEGMGLWTIGTLFPECAGAARWRARGAAVLERLGRELIYDDGTFSQHSTNYHRLMLHDYLWAIRLAEIQGTPFSDELIDRVNRAADLLFQLQDVETGRVPNLGANDGALILPLSSTDDRDYRPVIQATRYLTTRQRTFSAGPWDEDLFWLYGRKACAAPIDAPCRTDLNARNGGYHTLRNRTGFAFFRCPERFVDRPGHADALHVDIWWRGINIAQDAGTFSYNATGPWDNALAQTAVHNTVTVDGLSQMRQVSRFLWSPWLRGRVVHRPTSPANEWDWLEGRHDGYERLPSPVSHRRAIARIGPEHWLIIDDLHGSSEHDYHLQWLLTDIEGTRHVISTGRADAAIVLPTRKGDYELRAGSWSADATFDLVRAGAEGPRGWTSEHYQDVTPALSLRGSAHGDSARFWTVMGPGIRNVTATEGGLGIAIAEREVAVVLGDPLIASISIGQLGPIDLPGTGS